MLDITRDTTNDEIIEAFGLPELPRTRRRQPGRNR